MKAQKQAIYRLFDRSKPLSEGLYLLNIIAAQSRRRLSHGKDYETALTLLDFSINFN